jgi:hypothetical protein
VVQDEDVIVEGCFFFSLSTYPGIAVHRYANKTALIWQIVCGGPTLTILEKRKLFNRSVMEQSVEKSSSLPFAWTSGRDSEYSLIKL